MGKKVIGIAMSGGVDSTACALLLQKQYQVHGFFMQLAQPDFSEQLRRVKEVAQRCGIPLQVIDLRAQFDDKILNYFSTSYQNGRTPNPCMICNREIKFGLFMDAILGQGVEHVATGHYANITEEQGCFLLRKGKDKNKDQSYFLARLTQKQLAHTLFPLGEMCKEEVYTMVEEHGFSEFRGQESQDVCFLGASSVGDFLEKRMTSQKNEGEIVNQDGRVLGRHNGIYNYTIGQRRGLGISDSSPWYVVAIDALANRVIVGKDDALFRNTIDIDDVSWSCSRLPHPDRDYQVRIRYRHQGATARLSQLSENRYRITFPEKQRAVTPGQFAVIYDKDLILGSGEIQ
ncbi:MAG: tRNA 2-thiouridine(34) synthase MnmA [Proteobacteria bacterium]|nr:tRNA 2-thiouridine(34) synthase MnmA [Pseudomonadota bacterium]